MPVPYTFANQSGQIPLEELDANFAAVPDVANTAITVTANAQSNITSVGTLTSLSVAGNTVTNIILQKAPIVSLGANAGYSFNTDTIAIGNAAAGLSNQNDYAIAIGSQAAYNLQGANAISIGSRAGANTQGTEAIAVGFGAGNDNQGGNAIAIGRYAGNIQQGGNSIAIGRVAGSVNQGSNAIAIGRSSGNVGQGNLAIAIGRAAGNVNQGSNGIAIGLQAGTNAQSVYAIAIGAFAGNNNQGSNSIAIGAFAGTPVAANNSIILNGSNVALSGPHAGLYISPIRTDDGNVTNTLYFNTTTKEITYSTAGISSYGNANVAAYLPTYSGNMLTLDTVAASGNITGSYILGNGKFLTGITTSSSNIVNGNSSINIPAAGSNIAVAVNGSNVATFFSTGLSLPGNVTTGNVNANYLYGNGAYLSGIASGVNSRINVTVSSGTLAANAAANIIATGYKGYALYSINSNAAAWITLYTSNAAATSDYTRTISTDPTPGSGVVAESISNASATVNFTPAVIGFNNETVPTTAIPMKIVNNGNASANISVTLTLLKMEG